MDSHLYAAWKKPRGVFSQDPADVEGYLHRAYLLKIMAQTGG
jgi:hypothetical protein